MHGTKDLNPRAVNHDHDRDRDRHRDRSRTISYPPLRPIPPVASARSAPFHCRARGNDDDDNGRACGGDGRDHDRSGDGARGSHATSTHIIRSRRTDPKTALKPTPATTPISSKTLFFFV